MRNFNDSNGVKKCLNYDNDSSEHIDQSQNHSFICSYCNEDRHLPVKLLTTKQMYLTSYKRDFQKPILSKQDDLDYTQEFYKKKSNKDIIDPACFRPCIQNHPVQTKKHSKKKNDLPLPSGFKPPRAMSSQIFFSNDCGAAVKSNQKKPKKAPLKQVPVKKVSKCVQTCFEEVLIPQSNDLNKSFCLNNKVKEKIVFQNLRDHFPDETAVMKNEHCDLKKIHAKPLHAKPDLKAHFHSTRRPHRIHSDSSETSLLNTTTCILGECSEADSIALTSICDEGPHRRSKAADLNDFRANAASNKKAFFVENMTQEKYVKSVSRSNICQHINLVCGKCVRQINIKKHKLFQFDLEDCRKKFDSLAHK